MEYLGKLCGVAMPFDALSVNLADSGKPRFDRIVSGAVRVQSFTAMNFGHAEHVSLGIGDTWSDERAIYCQVDIENTPTGRAVFLGLRDFELSLSAQLADDVRTSVETQDGVYSTIASARLVHIAICVHPAFEDTCAWLRGTDPNDMPHHIRAAFNQWHFARLAEGGRASRRRPLIVLPPAEVVAQMQIAEQYLARLRVKTEARAKALRSAAS